MDNNNMDNNNSHKDLVTLFKILGDETRFEITRLLLTHDLCVGALAQMLNISKPAVSQHLKVLREAGLVRGEKRGYWTHYLVENEVLHDAARALHEMSETNRKESYLCPRQQESHEEMGQQGECHAADNNYSSNASSPKTKVLPMCENCCGKTNNIST